MTPLSLEQQLNRIQDQLIEWLCKRSPFVLLFLFIVTIAAAYLLVATQLNF